MHMHTHCFNSRFPGNPIVVRDPYLELPHVTLRIPFDTIPPLCLPGWQPPL